MPPGAPELLCCAAFRNDLPYWSEPRFLGGPTAAKEAVMAEPSPAPEKAPIVIKKYANRRLYNTATSSYVTLDYLCRRYEGVPLSTFRRELGLAA